MASLSMRTAPRLPARGPACRRTRSKLLCRAEAGPVKTPDWVPEQAGPLLKFLDSTNYKLEDNSFYVEQIKPYLDAEFTKQSTGWKELPETINGRAAMLGFVAAAGAEILGRGSVLAQLSKAPQPVLVLLLLVISSSLIPIYKGIQGDYLSALRDTYSVPEGVFTHTNERIHGRLAMLGLSGLLALELVLGRALL